MKVHFSYILTKLQLAQLFIVEQNVSVEQILASSQGMRQQYMSDQPIGTFRTDLSYVLLISFG